MDNVCFYKLNLVGMVLLEFIILAKDFVLAGYTGVIII